MEQEALFEVIKVTKQFTRQGGILKATQETVQALKGVDFSVYEFETLGIVGESGSGKTTLAKIIARLIEPSTGEVAFNPHTISNFRKSVQMIFQNPYNSLNPKMRVMEIIAEPLEIHRLCTRRQLKDKVVELLGLVGIADDALGRRPAEFSGGQRQRICIARALACAPRLLILDEPISSLDLIIQAQMLELFIDLKQKLCLTYVFISHNLAVIKHIADNLIVMHDGQIVEKGRCRDIFGHPTAAYTKMLLHTAKS